MFIELIGDDRGEVFVAVDDIRMIEQTDHGSVIVFRNGDWNLFAESADDVLRKIERARMESDPNQVTIKDRNTKWLNCEIKDLDDE